MAEVLHSSPFLQILRNLENIFGMIFDRALLLLLLVLHHFLKQFVFKIALNSFACLLVAKEEANVVVNLKAFFSEYPKLWKRKIAISLRMGNPGRKQPRFLTQ